MAAARALAFAAARRRVAPAPPAPAAALLGPRVAPLPPTAALLAPRAAPLHEGSSAPPPLGGRPAPPAAALLKGPRAPPPLGGRPALAAELLHGPRAPPPPPRAAALHAPRALPAPPPLGARGLRLLSAPTPPAAAPGVPGLLRLLSTGVFVQPGRCDEATRGGAVEAGFARDAVAAGGNKTSLVVDWSGRGGANSKALTRDTKLAGEIRGGDEVPTAAKAASGDVVQKAGALDILGARSALAAPPIGPRSPLLLEARLCPLQPTTTPLAAALGGLLRFSTGAATIQPDGDASSAPNGSKRATNAAGKPAAADTTRADIGSAKTKLAAAAAGDPRFCSCDGEGHETRGGKTAEGVVFDEMREMFEVHSKEERMRNTTYVIVLCLMMMSQAVITATIGVVCGVDVSRKMAMISDGKKTEVVKEEQQQQVEVDD